MNVPHRGSSDQSRTPEIEEKQTSMKIVFGLIISSNDFSRLVDPNF